MMLQFHKATCNSLSLLCFQNLYTKMVVEWVVQISNPQDFFIEIFYIVVLQVVS